MMPLEQLPNHVFIQVSCPGQPRSSTVVCLGLLPSLRACLARACCFLANQLPVLFLVIFQQPNCSQCMRNPEFSFTVEVRLVVLSAQAHTKQPKLFFSNCGWKSASFLCAFC